MAENYAVQKIKAALQEAEGNTTKAQKILIAQAMRDHELLLALVKPHMTGITAHAVNRVAQGKTKPETVTSQKSASQKISKDSIGMDILRTIAGGQTAEFGQENYGRPLGKKGASQRHIDAINQIIKSGQSKKS